MKKYILVIAVCVISFSVFGQDISGKWSGKLQGVELRVDFNLSAVDKGYTATLDSPDQNAYGIPVTSVEFKKPDIIIKINDISAEYKGKLSEENLIKGTFTQMGQVFPMDLTRKKEEK
jgi:hypothetical protein